MAAAGRGRTPLERTLIRRIVEESAFAEPTPEALEVIARYAPILEIGAGTGYWAYHLRRRGVTVVAYDKAPPDERRSPTGFRRVWSPVLRGRAQKAKKFPGHTLFLCWPEDDVASKALFAYRGRHVIFVGDAEGRHTNDPAFREALRRDFIELERLELPGVVTERDLLIVYRRAIQVPFRQGLEITRIPGGSATEAAKT